MLRIVITIEQLNEKGVGIDMHTQQSTTKPPTKLEGEVLDKVGQGVMDMLAATAARFSGNDFALMQVENTEAGGKLIDGFKNGYRTSPSPAKTEGGGDEVH